MVHVCLGPSGREIKGKTARESEVMLATIEKAEKQ
jgi:hypothetical protein